jgi:plasmid stabilization system protein ParE
MRRVLFTEAARADLAEAVDWYHVHAAQMVPEFRESAVARIAANPTQFPAGPYQTRRALLQRFPYLLIFRETDEDCYVVAVFHTRRDPTTWRRRTE